MSSNGFAPTNPNDHRAWLWVASIVAAIYSCLVLGARVSSKWELLYYDDAVLGVAYLFAFVHWGLLWKALLSGLGASLRLMPTESYTGQLYFASRIFLLISLGFIKASTVLFTRRIFITEYHKQSLAFNTALAGVCIWTLLAVLLSSAGCHASQILSPSTSGFCAGNIPRWKVITALDVVTEVVTVLLPTIFVMKNTIKRSKKVIVVFVYSFRLVVAAFSIVAMAEYFHYLHHGTTSIGLGLTVAWQEILLGTSLMSASIPSLRAFVWAFFSRQDGGRQYGIANSISMGGFGGGSTIGEAFRSLTKSQTSQQKDAQRTQATSSLGLSKRQGGFLGYKIPEETGYKASISTGKGRKSNSADQQVSRTWDDESQERIVGISRTVEVDFEEERGQPTV